MEDIRIGDYVKVIYAPESWEGAGESEGDRFGYIGHVGVVVALEELVGEDFALVRFPSSIAEYVGQRNIEFSCLQVVSRPNNVLPQVCVDEM